MTRRIVAMVFGAGLLLAAGCGGSSNGTKSAAPARHEASGGAKGTGATGATTATTADAGSELPAFMSDFGRVCSAQVGFGGAAGYEPTAGTHPIALFQRDDSGDGFFEASHTLPAGWTVTQDNDFKDNHELAGVQLIGCIERTSTTPTGTKCDFQNDGKSVTLEIVDASYTVTVYTATTARKLGSFVLDANTKECPYVAAYKEGDTQWVDTPTDDAFTSGLKQFVTPA